MRGPRISPDHLPAVYSPAAVATNSRATFPRPPVAVDRDVCRTRPRDVRAGKTRARPIGTATSRRYKPLTLSSAVLVPPSLRQSYPYRVDGNLPPLSADKSPRQTARTRP